MASTSGSGPRTENPHPSGFAVLPVHVLLDQDLNATDVRVLLALSSFVGGPEGSCFPSMRTISARAGGITKRQLARVFNGYSSENTRHPGLVERGYVEVLVRAPRSNVYTLRFDRWGSRKNPDTDVTPPAEVNPDTSVTVTPTAVSPSIKGREQNHQNNNTPQPPASGGRRLTRDDKVRIGRIRKHIERQARAELGCELCGVKVKASDREIFVQDGAISEWVSPWVDVRETRETVLGDLKPIEGEPDEEATDAFASLLTELRQTTRPSDMKYWILPLEPVRVRESSGELVLELGCPDPSHAKWVRDFFLPSGCSYVLDGIAMTVRVGVIERPWSEERVSLYHRSCAPDTEDKCE
jgi:hypothetical protein